VTSRIGVFRAAALGVAAVQLALAARSGAEEFWLVAFLAWGGARLVARAGADEKPAFAARVAGALLLAASLWELATAQEYRTGHRLAPLAGGLGLLLLAGGIAWVRANGRALVLLCLPLLHPPPRAVRELLDTSRATAFLSAAFLRLHGVAVERQGTLLLLPDSSLSIGGACSGINQIFELLALAVLAAVILELTPRQAAWLAGTAVAVGLGVNALRIAFLAVLADRGQMRLFDLWHLGGPSLLVSALATAVWGGLSLVILKSGGDAPSGSATSAIAP
jgi:cyanoexosortase A